MTYKYLFLYNSGRLSTRSKRAMLKSAKGFSSRRIYSPQYRLVNRLARELNWSKQKVVEQFTYEVNLLRVENG